MPWFRSVSSLQYLDGRNLGLYSRVRIDLRDLASETVAGDFLDCSLGYARFQLLGDGGVSEVVAPESSKTGRARQPER